VRLGAGLTVVDRATGGARPTCSKGLYFGCTGPVVFRTNNERELIRPARAATRAEVRTADGMAEHCPVRSPFSPRRAEAAGLSTGRSSNNSSSTDAPGRPTIDRVFLRTCSSSSM